MKQGLEKRCSFCTDDRLALWRRGAMCAAENSETWCAAADFPPLSNQAAGERIPAETFLSKARQQLGSTVVNTQAATWTDIHRDCGMVEDTR